MVLSLEILCFSLGSGDDPLEASAPSCHRSILPLVRHPCLRLEILLAITATIVMGG